MSKREKLALNKSNNDNINISDKKLIDLKNNNIVTDKLTKSIKSELVDIKILKKMKIHHLMKKKEKMMMMKM